jgi:hypothetical protein
MSRLRLVAASVVLLSSALAGCVSTKTIGVAPNVLDKYRGDTVAVTHRSEGGFLAQTSGKAMFGAIGAIAMIHAGTEILHNDQVRDPVTSIEQDLQADLVRDNGMTAVDTTVSTSTTDISKLVSQYQNADLLLDVYTTYWGFLYFPTNWTHYKVLYTARMRLIDTKTAKVLATGFCSRKPESSASEAPTYAELLGEHGALLKKKLAQAAQTCAEQFGQKVLLENTVASR